MICNENDSVTQYREIIEHAQYCEKIGVEARLEPLYDGHAIRIKKWRRYGTAGVMADDCQNVNYNLQGKRLVCPAQMPMPDL